MKKFIIFALGLGILAILAADTAFVIAGTASVYTMVETAVGWAFVLAVAIAAFIRTVNLSWPVIRKVTPQETRELQDRIDELESENDSLREERDELESRIDELNERIDLAEQDDDDDDEGPGVEQEPASALSDFADEHLEGIEPVVSTVGPDGKVTDLYALPPEPSTKEAYDAAMDSIRHRDAEGNPVQDYRIRFRPVYR